MHTGQLSLQTKLQAAYNAGRGLTVREIGYKCGIPKSSVCRILKEMNQEEKPRQRIDLYTQFRYHFVAMHIMKNSFITNRAIANESQHFDFKMSESTVGRISTAIGFKSKLQQPKEKLTEKQKQYRIRFAKEIPLTTAYLLPWCFSDECIICQEPFRKKIRILPFIDNEDQFYEKQGYPIKVMVWACIAKNFKSDLVKIEGNLNASGYQKMLIENEVFEKLTTRFGSSKGFVFQQDGARPHTAKSTKMFLEGKVTTLPDDLPWPASSPGLSVIEICWAILKARIDTKDIQTADDLYRAAAESWNKIPIETINLLIDSFDARLKTCINLEGNSLNGKKKLISMYKVSIEDGDNYIKKLVEEKQSIKQFIAESALFFAMLQRTDQNENQCNRLNYIESSRICNLLPQKILKRGRMPRPLFITY